MTGQERGDEFECVRLVPLFAALSPDIQHQVARVAVIRSFAPRERVYGPGERSGLFIVHYGRLKVYRVTESGAERLIRVMGPGDFLGETALLADTVSDHFAEAIQPSQICILGRGAITRLLNNHPEVARQMLEVVAERLGKAEQMLSALTGHSAGERLAQQLLRLADETGSRVFRLPTTKKDLASYLGTSAETLSRRLGALQESGVIRLGPRRRIEILDPRELQKLASP